MIVTNGRKLFAHGHNTTLLPWHVKRPDNLPKVVGHITPFSHNFLSKLNWEEEKNCNADNNK